MLELIIVVGFVAFLYWVVPALTVQRELRNFISLMAQIEFYQEQIRRKPELLDWESSGFEFASSSFSRADERYAENICGCTFELNFRNKDHFRIRSNWSYEFNVSEKKESDPAGSQKTLRIPSGVSLFPTVLRFEATFNRLKEEYYEKPKRLEHERIEKLQREKRIAEYSLFSPTAKAAFNYFDIYFGL